ncbi:hypothetical protein [Nocardioides albertanoniae]|nr:hypothetical protein [Nocardioides albertanoniae]
MIGASFGLIYVFVNSGALPAPVRWAVCLLAAFVFVAVAFLAVRRVRGGPAVRGAGPGSVFGKSYWLVVAIEVVALIGGARLLSGPLEMPEAGVAWVSVVVGVHFFALAVVFRQRFFHGLGALITACGAVGILLAMLGYGALPIDVVAGIMPGALLLAFGWWGVRRESSLAELQPEG